MNRITLSKLPKDILVEIVCKNFNNLNVEELCQIYNNRCMQEMDRYRKIIKSVYIVDDLHLKYREKFIYFDAPKKFHYEINIDCFIHNDQPELLSAFRKLISVQYTEERCAEIMSFFQKIIAARRNKKKLKNFIRTSNPYQNKGIIYFE